ncbi:HIRAN domain-containing protein [Dietzia sp. 179-F 9C3 NHS]|uniref:HIRAN domain-containing protein n=1 Tax=Dietzia sp. 179-F 9C3 NHS TaxID=3374295 RepID=UPI003879A473
MARAHVIQTYVLWSVNRNWQNFEIVGESNYLPAIRRAWNRNAKTEYNDVRVDLELVPEPDNPYDDWAISVRYQGHVVGYFSRETNRDWWPVIARVAGSGMTAVAPGRIWYQKSGRFENGSVQLGLGEPDMSLPLNDPPSRPHNLLPAGAVIQVTKEADHFDILADHVPPSGTGALYLTLHKEEIVTSRSRRVVAEVRLDGERVGELTKATSEKFLPAVEHNNDRGLVTAVRGAIKGSGIAAELTIRAAKAHELDDATLDGPAVRLPALAPFDPDAQYVVPDAFGQTTTAVRARAIREAKQAASRVTGIDHGAATDMPPTPQVQIRRTTAAPPQPRKPLSRPAPSPPAKPVAKPELAPWPNADPAQHASPAPMPSIAPTQPAQQPQPLGSGRPYSWGPPAPVPEAIKAKPAKPKTGTSRAIGFAVVALAAAFVLGALISGLGSPEGGAVTWLLGVPAAIGVGIWAKRNGATPRETPEAPQGR